MVKHSIKNGKIIILYIILLLWLIMSCFIIIDPITSIDNINEYYTYLKTGCNIKQLYSFTQNCSDEEKAIYYNYLQNLLRYVPDNITPQEIYYIQNLLKITFIKIYNWIPLIIISSIWIALSIILVLYYLKFGRKELIEQNEKVMFI